MGPNSTSRGILGPEAELTLVRGGRRGRGDRGDARSATLREPGDLSALLLPGSRSSRDDQAGGGDVDLRLQQLVLDLSLFREGGQASRGAHLPHERRGKERLRVDQQVLLLDPQQ